MRYQQVSSSPTDDTDSMESHSQWRQGAGFFRSKSQFGRFTITQRLKTVILLALVVVALLVFTSIAPTTSISTSTSAPTPAPDAAPAPAPPQGSTPPSGNIASPISMPPPPFATIAPSNIDPDPNAEYILEKLPALPAFPAAPFTAKEGPDTKPSTTNRWLAAIMVSAKDVQRRALVRNTWLRMYRDVPFDYVFVLGNPVRESTGVDGWVELVAAENATYGDLVVLDRVYEGAVHANTYKTVEFMRWLAERPWRNTYPWVSKVDGDSFIDARTFHKMYIEPLTKAVDAADGSDEARLGMEWASTSPLTFIGREVTYPGSGWKYAGGQFYTFSHDLVELLPRLSDKLTETNHWPHPNVDEDCRNSMILGANDYTFNLIKMPNEEAFDWTQDDAREGTGWAVDNKRQGEWVHAVGPRAINPHKMKTDAQWMQVAACFDENGLKTPPAGL